MRLFTSALLLAVCSRLCCGIVTEPVDNVSAIRLSQPKPKGRKTPQPAPSASQPEVTLNIIEPPHGVVLLGSTFVVKIDIIASDQEAFLSRFNTTDAKMCASLNAGPYMCWPALSGRIFFTEVEEMEHTLEAMLYAAGKLVLSTKTKTVFKTVRDLSAAGSAMDTSDVTDGGNNTEEAPTQVQVEYPRVGVSSPLNLVTYPGHSVELRFALEPTDHDSFERYFANAFVCVNVDQAPAFGCFAIYGDENYASPLLLNLKNGKHTLLAGLSHPSTGELLESSKSSTTIFYTAGELLEAATIAVDVTVADERHVVPLIEGTNLDAQTNAFCDSVGMAESKTCKERIKQKLWSAWEDMLQRM